MGNIFKKAKARLIARQKNYEQMIKKSTTGGKEFTRPGSMKK